MFGPRSVCLRPAHLSLWWSCFRSAQCWLKLGYLLNVLCPITLRARCKCDDLSQNQRGCVRAHSGCKKSDPDSYQRCCNCASVQPDILLQNLQTWLLLRTDAGGLSRLISMALFYVIPSMYLRLYFNFPSVPMTHVYTAVGLRCGLLLPCRLHHQKSFKRS